MPTTDLPLDARIQQSLRACCESLLKRGKLLTKERLSECYALFRERFGPERLKSLDGETLLNTMHAHGGQDSLVYWLEFKNDNEFPSRREFGSISGGSALKFGLYKNKNSGEWMTGSPKSQTPLSITDAISMARKHREQLLAAVNVVQELPAGADDAQYLALQKKLDQVSPDVSRLAWGHKYLSLIFPDKLDDFHAEFIQRHNLIKLLQVPPSQTGLYVSAGRFVRLALQMDWPMNHLTGTLNERNGFPIKYWRIGTTLRGESNDKDIWPDMKAGGYAAIGWPLMGDLTQVLDQDDAKAQLASLISKTYQSDPSVATRKAGEIFNFGKGMGDRDVILAADGEKILGVGRVNGPYRYDTSSPADAPNRRKVDWVSFAEWKLPVTEGLQTTLLELRKDDRNLVEGERQLLEHSLAALAPSKAPVANTLAAPFNEFFSSFEEANQGFDLLEKALLILGVDIRNFTTDRRICLSLPGQKKKGDRLRLNFGNWAILTFNNLSVGKNCTDYVCRTDQLPPSSHYVGEQYDFKNKVEGYAFGGASCPLASLLDANSAESKAFEASLAFATRRFKDWEGGPYPAHHQPQVLQMVFDRALRQEILKNGLASAPSGKNMPVSATPLALPALNIILYGPPGTGKTYRLRNHYMELFTDRQAPPTAEERASALVKDLPWWEAIALALLDSIDNKASVAQLLDHPIVIARLQLSANKNPRAMVWASLQSHTKKDCPNVNYTTRIDPLIFSKDAASLWSVDGQLADTEIPYLRKILHDFHNPPEEAPVCRYKFTTFHQSFSYEDFVEGIKPQTEEAQGRDNGQISYEIRLGVFREVCSEAKANPTKNYALFIDEINRGNVASIFGELITLIEEDKRLGKDNELKTTLPYSRDEFGVPRNLYIVGTMNTADRSVEALDTALRRRFTFEEMRPDVTMIIQPQSLQVDLRKLFEVINARIEQLLDHDHCIGHYYFMGIHDLAGLQSTFANKIIPLLREYFYGSPAKVGMVLGEPFVSRKTAKTSFASGSWGTDDLDEKEVYAFADVNDLTEGHFQAIYAEDRPGV